MIPKVGPIEGSLRAPTTFLPSLPSPWMSPIVVTVFPSPAGVGVIAVTTTSFPSFLSLSFSRLARGTFAMYLPYIWISSSDRPILDAISLMSLTFADSAISMSFIMSLCYQKYHKKGNGATEPSLTPLIPGRVNGGSKRGLDECRWPAPSDS